MKEMEIRPGRWSDGALPANVRIGERSVIIGPFAFKRFLTGRDPGLVIGHFSTLDGVQFAAGPEGLIRIGNYCHLSNVIVLAEVSVVIGNYVMVGWNTTIADCDFHPLDPAERERDAIACSPVGRPTQRPLIEKKAVWIEDDVYIGPSVTILKGVRIGKGAFIEPGSMVTRDVPALTRVLGNPARVVGVL